MRKSTKIIIILIPLTLVCVYLGVSWYVRKTFTLQISVPAIAEQARPIGGEVDKLDKRAREGTIPWRAVDHSSVGYPQQEAKLLQLRSGIDFFSGAFGHLPTDIKEMSRLPAQPANNYESLIGDCQILTIGSDSYILNCDGWSSPPS